MKASRLLCILAAAVTLFMACTDDSPETPSDITKPEEQPQERPVIEGMFLGGDISVLLATRTKRYLITMLKAIRVPMSIVIQEPIDVSMILQQKTGTVSSGFFSRLPKLVVRYARKQESSFIPNVQATLRH